MKIIVTGGAGFIGSNFIAFLLRKYPKYKVLCADSLTYAGTMDSINQLKKHPNCLFSRTDITHKEAVDKMFREFEPDIVVNFAAESHVDRSIAEPSVFLDTNIKGTAVLMDACLKYNVQRFHQVSTDEVYGELPEDRPDLLFTEYSPIRAGSPYSASKAGADILVAAYYRTYGLPVTISRCSNNYGPFQHPEKLIPLVIIHALKGLPIPVYGDGQNVRDWIYVEDHCRAIDLILHQGRLGNIYNIGASHEEKNIDIVNHICKELNKPDSLLTFVEDRKGHDRRYAVDMSKMYSEFGFKTLTGFADGIKSTIKWYIEHEEWWSRL